MAHHPLPEQNPWRLRLSYGTLAVEWAEGADGIRKMCHRVKNRIDRGGPPFKMQTRADYGLLKQTAYELGVDYDAFRAWVMRHRRGSKYPVHPKYMLEE